ncbi:hypothetical protein TNCV_154361 [Trichonephila clavipes]|uniref:Uncharacterized protein n=1 Tax=Trichonephila clavipes TaxID=2585209 RepID=A0A8X7BKU1_TRICX|nr:hypothetical protein TNCV_154361 [Trichonephila clavipes]
MQQSFLSFEPEKQCSFYYCLEDTKTLYLDRFKVFQFLYKVGLRWHQDFKAAFTPRQSASSIERIANQRLRLTRDEVSDWLGSDYLGVNAA